MSSVRTRTADRGIAMKKLFISQAAAGVILMALAALKLLSPAFLSEFDTINIAAVLYIAAAAGILMIFSLVFFLNRKVISYYLAIFAHTLAGTYLLITIYQVISASAFQQILPIAQSMVLIIVLALIAVTSIGCIIVLLKRLFS